MPQGTARLVAVNIVAQYTRSVVTVLLALVTTRLILRGLGQSDFGVYTVVAGVISLLGFVTNALITSTQRFLSYYCSSENLQSQRTIFASSLFLHVLIGIGLLVLLLACSRVVIYRLLVIDQSRQDAAMWVYVFSALTLLANFICAPFRAACVAHENIVFVSVVDVLDAVLRMCIAILLVSVTSVDRLIFYAGLLLAIALLNVLLIGGFALYRYQETRALSVRWVSRGAVSEISTFIGWSMYSSGCILLRTQGLAVVINRLVGTVANAAYGIAQQVLSAIYFLYQSVVNAMNPRLMRAEGEGDRQRMLRIALAECKVAYLVMLVVSVPLLVEMPTVLRLWLGEVPEYAVMMSRMIVAGCLIDQLTLGLNSANQATGKIASYSLLVNTPKALSVPVAVVLAWIEEPMSAVVTAYLSLEMLSMLLRLPHLHRSVGLSLRDYVKVVAVPCIVPTLLVVAVCYGSYRLMEASYMRLAITVVAAIAAWLITTWLVALSRDERQLLLSIFKGTSKNSSFL